MSIAKAVTDYADKLASMSNADLMREAADCLCDGYYHPDIAAELRRRASRLG